jgi:ABC-type branched-subunit amino acid transport system substrate-binding protein
MALVTAVSFGAVGSLVSVDSTAGAASQGPIKVAVEGPMTGTQSSTGIDMLHGAQLAVSKINAAGGVLGRNLQIVVVNDKAKPSVAVSVAKRAIAQGASAVVGPFNSAVGVKNLPTYRSAGLSIVRLTSATNTEGFGITTQPMVRQIAPVEAAELTNQLHAKSVDVLYDPSTYTSGIATQLVSLLKGQGVAIPVNRPVSPTATASQSQAALNAVGAKSAAVIYLAMYGPQAGQFARAMAASQAAGHTLGQCFVDLAAQGPSFVTAAGKTAAHECLNSGVPSSAQLPLGASYTAAYQARFHTTPGTWGAFTYDSMVILASAMISAHQVRGSAVRAALASTTGFSGVTGTTTVLKPSGNRQNPPVVILDIGTSGQYSVNPTWAAATGYPTSSGPPTAPLPAP